MPPEFADNGSAKKLALYRLSVAKENIEAARDNIWRAWIKSS